MGTATLSTEKIEATKFFWHASKNHLNRAGLKDIKGLYPDLHVIQVEAEKLLRMKHPPLPNGTEVFTTEANQSIQKEFSPEARVRRQWGVRGKIVHYHDSHGLSYEVLHPDGTIGDYDPTEIAVPGNSKLLNS